MDPPPAQGVSHDVPTRDGSMADMRHPTRELMFIVVGVIYTESRQSGCGSFMEAS
jgi:hypothetical protein